MEEYWNVLPFPSPGDHPDPGIKPGSSASQADSLLTHIINESICTLKHIMLMFFSHHHEYVHAHK